MSNFTSGRSSKIILAVLLTGSIAGAAIAAEAVRTRASDAAQHPVAAPTEATTAKPAPVEAESVEADTHEARVALYLQKVQELRAVQGSFWRAGAPQARSARVNLPRREARLALPRRHAATQATAPAPVVLLPPEQLRAEVGKGDADCLAQAVYFEARGEPAEGQAAVAQVVMNRVRSPYYPKTVCGVVFQGATHAGCQFSFTCDGSLRHGVRNQVAWTKAQDVAAQVLRGEQNAARLAPALNYHADYVRPKWASRLAKLEQIGRHIFYQAVGGMLPEGGKASPSRPAPAAPAFADKPPPAWA